MPHRLVQIEVAATVTLRAAVVQCDVYADQYA